MDPFILDSSFALAWCFKDERTERTEAVRLSLESAYAVVPPLWEWEWLNGLLVASRRLRIAKSEITTAIKIFEHLPIRTDPDWQAVSQELLILLADHHQLTIYDAAYLELAQRLKLPLATLDQALVRAAGQIGVQVL